MQYKTLNQLKNGGCKMTHDEELTLIEENEELKKQIKESELAKQDEEEED